VKDGLEWATWEHYEVGQPGPRSADPTLAHPRPALHHMQGNTRRSHPTHWFNVDLHQEMKSIQASSTRTTISYKPIGQKKHTSTSSNPITILHMCHRSTDQPKMIDKGCWIRCDDLSIVTSL